MTCSGNNTISENSHQVQERFFLRNQVCAGPKYGKIVKKPRKLHAHDESFEAKMGDTVKIMETKPISKSKRWRVTEVIERAR